LFTRLNKEEAEVYFDDRVEKGFNVLQVSVIHMLNAKNVYGDSALVELSLAHPLLRENHYDFWDHVDYLVDLAAEKGLYLGLVPVWGNNVRYGGVSYEEAASYAHFLAGRYGDRSNIVWMNGGDTFGNDSTETWRIIGKTLSEKTNKQLVTYHPRGRCSSSDWFHQEEWLDFNQIQSGHRRYDQDDSERGYGQDNWRFVSDDYLMKPTKPTIDAEPSYEGIPQGLHDPNEKYWDHNDVRRYAYWSVFAGAFGFTYGHNSIMQFHSRDGANPAFGAREYWDIALNSTGSQQMKHLKELMLSRSFFDRVPAQELLAENGEKYAYCAATRGGDYAFIYTYRGGQVKVDLDALGAGHVKASWFNPRIGVFTKIGEFEATGIMTFSAPGMIEDGNDWVLVLDVV
ncbi:MAG: glycoside hydrolase family 140 protein, partial [Bacteroidales bacterium]|nr:glycoside hydrolase family 140 protein [Bacteroidales bacterium]